MPYFVYRIKNRPFKTLEKVSAFDSFREASAYAKSIRTDQDEGTQIKVIFAETELQAEDLLNEVRQPQITGEE